MRFLFIFLMAIAGLVSLYPGKTLAIDTKLQLHIEPILCTIDNVNNGVSNSSYLTPENCSNYYELFPRPANSTQNPEPEPTNLTSSPRQTEGNNERPFVITKKPAHSTTVSSKPLSRLVGNIRNDPVSTTAILFGASALMLSFVDFYKDKRTDVKK